MRKKIVLIVIGALVLLLLGSFGGWVLASNHGYKKYPYLSDYYNEPYTPTRAEWEALSFTAEYNSEVGITDKIVLIGCNVYLRDTLIIHVGTQTQPDWDVYLGNGRFSVSDRELRAAYIDAADMILKHLRYSFPEEVSGLSEQEIEMTFFIYGTSIGTWQGGGLKLKGEE